MLQSKPFDLGRAGSTRRQSVARQGTKSRMKALILAGGEGTRLRPLTLHTPKPVVPVVTVPFLKYQVELLRQHGIREVILSLSYQPGKIEEVLGDGSGLGVKIHYVVEKIPLGTAGAFKNAEALLDGATLVFNGDILCELDLTDVIRQHQIRQAAATLVLTRVENPSAYGLVETLEDGRITRFLEKPGTDEITCNTINAGTYILEQEALSLIPPGRTTLLNGGCSRPCWKDGDRCGLTSPTVIGSTLERRRSICKFIRTSCINGFTLPFR